MLFLVQCSNAFLYLYNVETQCWLCKRRTWLRGASLSGHCCKQDCKTSGSREEEAICGKHQYCSLSNKPNGFDLGLFFSPNSLSIHSPRSLNISVHLGRRFCGELWGLSTAAITHPPGGYATFTSDAISEAKKLLLPQFLCLNMPRSDAPQEHFWSSSSTSSNVCPDAFDASATPVFNGSVRVALL